MGKKLSPSLSHSCSTIQLDTQGNGGRVHTDERCSWHFPGSYNSGHCKVLVAYQCHPKQILFCVFLIYLFSDYCPICTCFLPMPSQTNMYDCWSQYHLLDTKELVDWYWEEQSISPHPAGIYHQFFSPTAHASSYLHQHPPISSVNVHLSCVTSSFFCFRLMRTGALVVLVTVVQ